MLQAVGEELQTLLGLGLDVADVAASQMVLRTVIIYAFTLAIVRLGSKRFLAQASALDVIVGIMLGSLMSRAINSSAPFFPTLAAGIVLIAMHWLLALLAFHIGWFGRFVKGNPVLLIREGRIQEEAMMREGITQRDLIQALREKTKISDPQRSRSRISSGPAGSASSPSRTSRASSTCRSRRACRRFASSRNDVLRQLRCSSHQAARRHHEAD